MNTHRKNRVRPVLDSLENRSLMTTLAVAEVLNQSSYNVSFDFRWTPSSSWTAVTEAPGQGQLFWANYSSSLSPQVYYNTTTSAGSGSTINLAQGYGQWTGTGTPPAPAAVLYDFQNTSTGIQLYFSPPVTTDAVVDIVNSSSYTVSFDFRWSPTSPWTLYKEAPGQSQEIYTPYSNSLAPQVYYNTTTSGSPLTVNLSQGYGEWTGNGTPPVASAQDYVFLNSSNGITLYYQGAGMGAAPSPVYSGNWSGYVAETNLKTPASNSVTYVVGSWKVPAVTGSGTKYSSVWVGIDGNADSTVEQCGTEEDIVNGKPVYDAWWEMYSSGAKQPEQVISGMAISPGDSITASVQYFTSGPNAGQFLMTVIDATTKQSFSTYQTSAATQKPGANRSSAEWIVEAPTVSGGIASLANFGRATITNASATINGVTGAINSSSWQSEAVNMGTSAKPLDTTSVLGSSGTSFAVNYNPANNPSIAFSSSFGIPVELGASPTSTTVISLLAPTDPANPQVIQYGLAVPTGSQPLFRPAQAFGLAKFAI